MMKRRQFLSALLGGAGVVATLPLHRLATLVNPPPVTFEQLAPMAKIPLATIDMANRWSQRIFIPTALHYEPSNSVLFINVGKSLDTMALVSSEEES